MIKYLSNAVESHKEEKLNAVELKDKMQQLRQKGNYKELIKLCNEIIIKAEEEQDQKKKLLGYLHRGVSYYYVGDIENAFKDLIKHRSLIDEDGKPADFLNSYNFFFVLYLHNKDYENCKKTLDKSLKLAKELGYLHIISNGYSNYSHVLNLEKKYKKALKMAKLGIKAAEAFEPYRELLVLRVKLNYIKSLVHLEKFEKAKAALDIIKNYECLEHNKRELASVKDLTAFYYYKKGSLKEARKFQDEAITIVESYQDLNLLKEMLESQIKICARLKDYKKKSQYQDRYTELLNTIKESELDKLSLTLDIQHQIKERAKEIELLKERNQLLKVKNKRIQEQSNRLEYLYEELWHVYDETNKESQRDYLTGVYNRQYIEEYLKQLLFEKNQDSIEVSCLIFDIDNFKTVNDTYGHLAGDVVIKEICKVCEEILDNHHKISRYGGDEFIIVLEDTPIDEATQISTTLIETIESTKVLLKDLDETINVTLSIGVANNQVHQPKDVKELIYHADIGLYNAKRNGRNQYSIHRESNIL